MTLLRSYLQIVGQGESVLTCSVGGETARIPHLGYYLLPANRILIPLYDDSFILVGRDVACDGGRSCSDFRLFVGNESLRSIDK